MEKVTLSADLRMGIGKSEARSMRKIGKIPAVVYRGGKIGMNIQVDSKALWHALHTGAGENAIITLDINDEKGKEVKKTVMVREVQLDPVTDKLMHVDFHEISLKEKIKVKVPVIVKGEAKGVLEQKGIMNQVMWEIEVECLPTDIPARIEIKADNLMIGDAIHLSEVVVPKEVVVVGDPNQVVVTVTVQKAEEEVKEAVVEGAEAVEPELIKKGKKEEEGEEGEESEEGGKAEKEKPEKKGKE